MTKQSFLKGTIILIIAGMITRFLGFINRLVVARVMGQVGVGLYMMALPTLFLVLTLTQIGLPTAISKRVAEATTKGQKHKVKQILIVSLTITGCTTIFIIIALVSLLPWISPNLYPDQRFFLPSS